MRCIICNMEKDGSKEHIIPEAMGNSKLITYKVCEECNNRLGSKVDNYLTDYILTKIIRKKLGFLGKNEKKIKIFPSILSDEKGEEYLFRDDIPKKKAVVENHDGVLHIEADNLKEALGIARKCLNRMGKSREEIEELLSTYRIGEKKNTQPTFTIPADIDMSKYLLAGIKIAYEYTCELFGDIYIEDDVAKVLRNQLYKASIADKNDKECIEYKIIKQYSSLPFKASLELKEKMKPMLDSLQPKARHVIIIHDSADHKMICEVFLCCIDFLSFTICVSEDATKYLGDATMMICVVLENDEIIVVKDNPSLDLTEIENKIQEIIETSDKSSVSKQLGDILQELKGN